MNEWVAFGIVAVICGLLAVLVRWAGNEDAHTPESEAANEEPRARPLRP